jgi:hypothetical protein
MSKALDPSQPLPKARHEAFCRHLAAGLRELEAYRKAGYNGTKQGANRLALKEHIRGRMRYLKEQAAERTIVTVADIAVQLDDDREFARVNKSASAAVQATMGKAKVLGLIVDRHVLGLKRIEDMTEQELRALLGLLESERDDGSS